MKYLDLETISDFVCTGSDCPYTCCGGGWEIQIDKNTYEYYRSVTGQMGERLERNIEKLEDRIVFKLTPDKNCPFLNDRGLCDIYINLGEEHLCFTCTYYPRYSFCVGDIRFSGVSVSCPEVSQFFLTHTDQLLIDFAEDDTPVSNDTSIDWNLFNKVVRVFTSAVSIAQNRDLFINERIALILIFIYRFQECIDQGINPDVTINLFSEPSQYIKLLPQTGIYNRDFGSKVKFTSEVLNNFKIIASLDRQFPELYSIMENFNHQDSVAIEADQWMSSFRWMDEKSNDLWQENILNYILFRYFMRGFSTGEYYKSLTKGLVIVLCANNSILSLYRLQHGSDAPLDYRIMLISHLSRLVEHASSTADSYYESLRSDGICDLSFMLKLIS